MQACQIYADIYHRQTKLLLFKEFEENYTTCMSRKRDIFTARDYSFGKAFMK